MKEQPLLDPVSSKAIKNAVIICHKNIAPLTYERQSVERAAENGELKKFGITSENLKDFMYADQLTQAIIDQITNDDGLIKVASLENLCKDVVSLAYPRPPAVLCVRDGRMYEWRSMLNIIDSSGSSPFNRKKIDGDNQLVKHPIFEHLQKAIDSHHNDTIDLCSIFQDFKQKNFARISFYKAKPMGPKNSILMTLSSMSSFFLYGFKQHATLVGVFTNSLTTTLMAMPAGLAYLQSFKSMHHSRYNLFYHPNGKKSANNKLPMLYGTVACVTWHFLDMNSNFAKHSLLRYPGRHHDVTLITNILKMTFSSAQFFKFTMFAKALMINRENITNELRSLSTRPLTTTKMAKIFMLLVAVSGILGHQYLDFSDKIIFDFQSPIAPSLTTARMFRVAVNLPYNLGIAYMGYKRATDLLKLNDNQNEGIQQNCIELATFKIATILMVATTLITMYAKEELGSAFPWLTLLFTLCELSIPHMMKNSLPVIIEEPAEIGEDSYELMPCRMLDLSPPTF